MELWSPESDKWIRHRITIDEGSIGLYTDEEKAEILSTSDEDLEQEYYCKASTSRTSYLGSLTEDDFTSMIEGDYALD